MSLPHVQALLLLTCWPLPNLHLWTDNSLILSNIALTSAIHLGLHRPGREEEYSQNPPFLSTATQTERTRTWLACLALSQWYDPSPLPNQNSSDHYSFSADFGHAPFFSFADSTVLRACQRDPTLKVPQELQVNVMIQRCMHHVCEQLSQNAQHAFGLPQQSSFFASMERLESNFDALEKELPTNTSFANRIRYLHAKLTGQCVYFLDDTLSAPRKTGVLAAYSTASSLINTVLSEPTSHELLPYAPLTMHRPIWLAAVVLFRVLQSAYAASVDFNQGRILFHAAAFSMRQLSVQHKEKDIAVRGSELLTRLWQGGERDSELRSQEPRLRVKSRMGASVAYDTLVIARRYGGQQHSHSSTQPSSRPDHPVNSTFSITDANTSDLLIGDANLDPMVSTLKGLQEDFSGVPSDWDDMSWMDNFAYPGLFEQHL